MFKYFLIFFLSFSKTKNLNGQYKFSSGISYSSESFNLENIKGGTIGSIYDHIQYEPSFFYGTVHFNNSFAKLLNKTTYIALNNFIRYNHHYYKRLPRQSGLEPHYKIPQTRKLKMDIFFEINKIIPLRKYNFIYGFGLGFNNINSGYNFTYNEIIQDDPYLNGTLFNKNFKGSWLYFTPIINLGYKIKAFSLVLDAMLTKDPTFNKLLSTSVRLTFKKEILKF